MNVKDKGVVDIAAFVILGFMFTGAIITMSFSQQEVMETWFVENNIEIIHERIAGNIIAMDQEEDVHIEMYFPNPITIEYGDGNNVVKVSGETSSYSSQIHTANGLLISGTEVEASTICMSSTTMHTEIEEGSCDP